MAGVLVVSPLHLDDFTPSVVDPSDQVVELLVRRPTAVASTLAAVAVARAVDSVVLVEPVSGDRDGGYATACIDGVVEDLRRRGVQVGRLSDQVRDIDVVHQHRGRAFIAGWLVGGDARSWSPLRLVPGAALHCCPDGRRPEPIVVDPLVSVRPALTFGGRLDRRRLLDALTDLARRTVAAHPYRYVVATAELHLDADGRRLVQWPGLREQVIADVRQETARRGLPLWWDDVRLAPVTHTAALQPHGPYCSDPLTLDLLGLGPDRVIANGVAVTSELSQRGLTSTDRPVRSLGAGTARDASTMMMARRADDR